MFGRREIGCFSMFLGEDVCDGDLSRHGQQYVFTVMREVRVYDTHLRPKAWSKTFKMTLPFS